MCVVSVMGLYGTWRVKSDSSTVMGIGGSDDGEEEDSSVPDYSSTYKLCRGALAWVGVCRPPDILPRGLCSH
jgi:hypothetical protein